MIFDDGNIIIVIGLIIAIALASTGLSFLAIKLFNWIPASWLVDYGEEVSDEMSNGNRLTFRKNGMFLAIYFTGIIMLILMHYYNIIYLPVLLLACFILIIIGISDKKYMIIPDQAVIALAISGLLLYLMEIYLGRGNTNDVFFHHTLYSPLLGALIGGGTIFAIGFIGSVIVKKEAMGFGDVKLLAAVGALVGTYGIILVLIMTVLISGIWFIILMLAQKLKRGDYQPLGPFIVAATVIYICFFDAVHYLVNLYLGQF